MHFSRVIYRVNDFDLFCLFCRHNTHHYLRFFRSIREAIKVGEFDLFRQQFVKKRRAHIAAAVL
jgi:tRNA-guanine family transglycosylase